MNSPRGSASSFSVCLSELHLENEEVASVEAEAEQEHEVVCQTWVGCAVRSGC